MNIVFPADLVSVRCFKRRIDESGVFSKVELSDEILAMLSLVVESDPMTAQKLIFGVNLDLIVSEFHLKSSIVKALLNQEQKSMKTKAIASEVLYQCAATGKINEAIKQFGFQPNASTFAVIVLNNERSSDVNKHFHDLCHLLNIDFDEFPIEELEYSCTPEKAVLIGKVFKLTSQEVALSRLGDVVMMRLALKGIE